MNVDEATFRAIVAPILPPQTAVSHAEVTAISQLAYLAYDADLDEHPEERSLLDQLGGHVCALAGVAFDAVERPSPVPLPEDNEARIDWLRKLAAQLPHTWSCELAFVVAYLLIAGDLSLAPVESVFLTELAQVLRLSEERTRDLALFASAQVTARDTETAAAT